VAGSKRTFEYRLRPEPDEFARAQAKAGKILAWACEGDKRIECHGISGEALGVITLNLTIVNRDQWACRQLAQDILNLVTWGLAKDNLTKLELQSRRQAPHTTRGYAGGRTKTWRAKPEDLQR
jgi:hypothetical protein